MRRTLAASLGAGCLICCLFAAGCWVSSGPEVVVYTALDSPFSEPILDDFRKQSGIAVRPKFDVESTKTVGLAKALMAERNRPRCDVFWNNEILHTLRLEKAGLLDVYHAGGAADFPTAYVSPNGTWHGFAARARVLIVNTDLVPESERPTSIHDLVDPRWKGKVGIAKPLFGTTATHAAVLFAKWGDQEATAFFEKVHKNALTMSGNKGVAEAVGASRLAFGLTDTDDAIIEVDNGNPVAIVFPDQGPDQLGTLFIPNTLCIIKGSPNVAHARQLVDYLLSSAVERRLALGSSAQFPLNPAVQERSRAFPDRDLRWMDVDFPAAAARWDTTSQVLDRLFRR